MQQNAIWHNAATPEDYSRPVPTTSKGGVQKSSRKRRLSRCRQHGFSDAGDAAPLRRVRGTNANTRRVLIVPPKSVTGELQKQMKAHFSERIDELLTVRVLTTK